MRSQNGEKQVIASSCLFVSPFVRPSFRMGKLGSHWTNLYEIWYLNIYLNLLKKLTFFFCNMKRTTGTLHGDHKTFLIIFHSIILRMRNFSDKSCGENQNTQYVFNKFFFRKSCLYKIKCKNTVERGRPQMTIWRMRIAC